MQSASDIMLGWIHVSKGLDGQERDFYIRQLWDGKGSALVDADGAELAGARTRSCAAGRSRRRTPARATRSRSSSYLGTSDVFDKAMAVFAETYADQNERDYDALKQAVDSGRVKAETGL